MPSYPCHQRNRVCLVLASPGKGVKNGSRLDGKAEDVISWIVLPGNILIAVMFLIVWPLSNVLVGGLCRFELLKDLPGLAVVGGVFEDDVISRYLTGPTSPSCYCGTDLKVEHEVSGGKRREERWTS